MELVSIENAVYYIQIGGTARSKAITQLANELGVSVPTIYRWIKDGDHFIYDDDEMKTQSVFKLVKCKEVGV